MTDIKHKFGANIKKLRLERNLSQESLANECNIDRTYISSIEKGERNITLIIIEKLAKGLNVEIAKLFD